MPAGCQFDKDGNLYVADMMLGILKITQDGSYSQARKISLCKLLYFHEFLLRMLLYTISWQIFVDRLQQKIQMEQQYKAAMIVYLILKEISGLLLLHQKSTFCHISVQRYGNLILQ